VAAATDDVDRGEGFDVILRDFFGAPAFKIADRHWQSGFPMPFIEQMKHVDVDVVSLASDETQPDQEGLANIKRDCPHLSLILCPFKDTDDPTKLDAIVKIARGVADKLAGHLRDGKTILSTCSAGRNRSGLISGLVLMKRYGLTGKEAVERVRLARPNALTNDVFREYLESLP